MEHPLINNVNDLTIDQLQSKITELNKKLNFALRTGNASLVGQLQMALETFNNQYRAKLQEQYEKSNRGPDFSDRIDIS
jgi:hypothetical protein